MSALAYYKSRLSEAVMAWENREEIIAKLAPKTAEEEHSIRVHLRGELVGRKGQVRRLEAGEPEQEWWDRPR